MEAYLKYRLLYENVDKNKVDEIILKLMESLASINPEDKKIK